MQLQLATANITSTNHNNNNNNEFYLYIVNVVVSVKTWIGTYLWAHLKLLNRIGDHAGSLRYPSTRYARRQLLCRWDLRLGGNALPSGWYLYAHAADAEREKGRWKIIVFHNFQNFQKKNKKIKSKIKKKIRENYFSFRTESFRKARHSLFLLSWFSELLISPTTITAINNLWPSNSAPH